MSGFHPEFAKYQVVVRNYQGDPWPEPTKQAFVDYVKNGGGVVVYHFALAAFPEWKEYNEMIGLGGWGGRMRSAAPTSAGRTARSSATTRPGSCGSHGPQQAFQLVVRERGASDHQGLAAGLHARGRRALWLAPRPGRKPHGAGHGLRAQGEGGGGRARAGVVHHPATARDACFQECLGHDVPNMKSVAFIVTFQRGAEWAASGQVTQKVPADFPTAEKATIRQ